MLIAYANRPINIQAGNSTKIYHNDEISSLDAGGKALIGAAKFGINIDARDDIKDYRRHRLPENVADFTTKISYRALCVVARRRMLPLRNNLRWPARPRALLP